MPPEPSEQEDCCHIVIKLANGERIRRRFLFTDSLQLVFDFVDIHLDQLNNSFLDEYNLVSQFPRKVYSRSDDISLSKAGFVQRMSLIYEETDL